MSDDIPGLDRSASDSRLLPWLLSVLAGAHGLAAASGLLPHGGGPLAVGADAVLAALALAGVLATVLAPRPLADAAVLDRAAIAVIGLAGLVSGLRAARSGSVWLGADVVLALLAAVALRRRATAWTAIAAALVPWTVALLVGGVTGSLRPPVVDGVVLAVTVAAAAAGALVLHQDRYRTALGLSAAVRTAGQQAVTDPLTGVTNRRGLELMALPMIEHARRQGEAAHCLFIDLDAFRTVNEALGRSFGDDVLTAVCEALLASVRATDVVGRWAGDQFVVIGPGTGTSPLEMERRVRSHLAENPPVPQDVWDGRVSIGSATLVPWDEGNIDSLLRRAEEDMQLRRSLRRQSRARSLSPAVTPGDQVPTERRTDPPKTPPPPASPTVKGDH